MLAPNTRVFVACSVILGGVVLFANSDGRLPGDHTGYAPDQPIAYSHRVHAGELGIDCEYCHYGAETSPVAGIPPASVCMNCHNTVTTSGDATLAEKIRADAAGEAPRRLFSPQIRRLYDALGLDDDGKKKPGVEPTPIRWVRVHDLPDYVYFDHRPHVARMECQVCHGPVEAMERVRQVNSMSMGWCVDCHRLNAPDGAGVVMPGEGHPRLHHHVNTDCSVCHY